MSQLISEIEMLHHEKEMQDIAEMRAETLSALTELEKATLRQAFGYGFAFDNPEDDFICWGVEGKQERGALTSMNKKGILNVYTSNGDTYVCCGAGYTKEALIAACEYSF